MSLFRRYHNFLRMFFKNNKIKNRYRRQLDEIAMIVQGLTQCSMCHRKTNALCERPQICTPLLMCTPLPPLFSLMVAVIVYNSRCINSVIYRFFTVEKIIATDSNAKKRWVIEGFDRSWCYFRSISVTCQILSSQGIIIIIICWWMLTNVTIAPFRLLG